MSAPLFQNAWFGKATGCAAAFIFAGEGPVALSLAVLVGIGAGHLIDEWGRRSAAPGTEDRPEVAERRLLCLIMGHIAKQGGTVRRAHLDLVEDWFAREAFDRAERAQAIRWFNEGKGIALNRLKRVPTDSRQYSSSASVLLLARLAAVQPSDRVLAATVSGAELLGIAPGAVSDAFRDAVGGPAKPTSTSPQAAPLQWAYDRLGLNAEASADEVKTAYRRLVSRHHPDKLGPDATRKQIETGKTTLIELKEALDAIQSA